VADDIEYGPTRFTMHCTLCGERTAYPTQAIADDKLELHHAFVHTAAGRPRRPVANQPDDGGAPSS
jgi:hypothetical protein